VSHSVDYYPEDTQSKSIQRACNQGYSIMTLQLLKEMLSKPFGERDMQLKDRYLPQLLEELLVAAAKKGLLDVAEYLINTHTLNPKV
jgi:hypothetical protein